MPRRRAPAAVLILVLAALLAGLLIHSLQPGRAAGPAASQDGVSVYFSPKGGCTAAIVERLDQAQRTILIQAYSFTSKPIAQAVLSAHQRGVKITVILDSQRAGEQYSEATFLRNQGIPVFLDGKHPIHHNKIVLIDDRFIITGSFNFTKQAEEGNAENLLIIQDKPQLFEAYRRNFELHLGHSEAYGGT